jgi:pimeloyl-ACP methyl ester carboxylesterase
MSLQPAEQLRIFTADGVGLAAEQTGDGPPIVLLHGLTATRRYVVMGSRTLERSGHRVIAYDARGHGRSSPAPASSSYGYERLTEDLLSVLDHLEVQRALIVGASMGAHTAVSLALSHPHRIAALCLITPAYDPRADRSSGAFAGWDALAEGLRVGGVQGFLDAYDLDAVPDAWRQTVEQVIRQRLALHEHPLAVADALEAVPRSRPFEELSELQQIDVPTLVIASRDEADPGHPLAIAETYARTIPSAGLALEDAGRSPIAWQGGQLSRLIAELLRSAATE